MLYSVVILKVHIIKIILTWLELVQIMSILIVFTFKLLNWKLTVIQCKVWFLRISLFFPTNIHMKSVACSDVLIAITLDNIVVLTSFLLEHFCLKAFLFCY